MTLLLVRQVNTKGAEALYRVVIEVGLLFCIGVKPVVFLWPYEFNNDRLVFLDGVVHTRARYPCRIRSSTGPVRSGPLNKEGDTKRSRFRQPVDEAGVPGASRSLLALVYALLLAVLDVLASIEVWKVDQRKGGGGEERDVQQIYTAEYGSRAHSISRFCW